MRSLLTASLMLLALAAVAPAPAAELDPACAADTPRSPAPLCPELLILCRIIPAPDRAGQFFVVLSQCLAGPTMAALCSMLIDCRIIPRLCEWSDQ